MLTMKKTQLIKKYIGNTLKKYGFSYIGCDFFTLWIFRKKVNDITQEICIQQKNLIEPEIKLCLFTGVYGWGDQEPQHFIEKYKGKEFWKYETEEEYIEILKLFCDIIVNYGLEMLEKMMKPTTKEYPSPELNKYLYERFAELQQKYETQYNILEKASAEAQLNAISQTLMEHRDDVFEQCKELLMGMAAIYATIIQRELGGKNHFDGKHFKVIEIGKGKNTELPFVAVFNGWKFYRDRGDNQINVIRIQYNDLNK